MRTKGLWNGFAEKVFMVAAIAVAITSCTASTPAEDFMNTSVGVIYSNNRIPNIVKEVTLRDFIAASKPGSWEKIDDNQWIYRVKLGDQLTKQNSEVSMLFVRQQMEGNDGVFLHRVVSDGQEMPGLEKDTLFNQIAYGIVRAREKR